MAAVLHEDDDDEGQDTQQTKAAASRMRQHNRSAQRRYREKQRVGPEVISAASVRLTAARAAANECMSRL